MEPHPDQDDQPEAGTRSRGGLIAAVVVGGIFLILVVLHVFGAMSLHSP
jgi:hypothetical protein